MNEEANGLHCRLLSFGDTGQLRRSAPCRYLAGAGGWLYNGFSYLHRHYFYQMASRLEVI